MFTLSVKNLMQALPLAFLTAVLAGGCQQISSIDDQLEDSTEFSQISRADKNEIIEDWHDMITLDQILESGSHCCFIRYQHALKHLAKFVRDADYKQSNRTRYEKIIAEYFKIANSSTDLKFMTICLEKYSDAKVEVMNIRKAAMASLIAMGDDGIFPQLLEAYADYRYDYPVQVIIADGLIKYLPNHKNVDVCAKIILKSMVLKKKQQNYSAMKEIEHLTGKCISFATLNEAIRQSRNDTPILELVLELNLNYWRQIQQNDLEFSERAALENIALMKSLVIPAATEKIDNMVFFTLCEIVPAESLVVLNTKMEAEPSFRNMKNMLSFYWSLNKMNVKSSAKLNKLTNTGKAIQTCKKLAKDFIEEKLTSLPLPEQQESYELYARNLPGQAYEFLCRKFVEGKESIPFYETAVNAALWMISQKIYNASQAADINKAIDKLLYSCRHRKDYKQIFELVHANKNSYLNQWQEMYNSVRQADVFQKDAFIDSFVTLITRIEKADAKNLPKDFKTRNKNVFEYIIAAWDVAAVLKLIPYLEKCGEQKFLLDKFFKYTFGNDKFRSSFAHVSVAGDLAARHLKELKADKKLYDKYLKLLYKCIASKDDDMSLMGADYYFRIVDPKDKTAVEAGRKEFAGRWPNSRPVAAGSKN